MKNTLRTKQNAIILILICVFTLSYISLIFNNNIWTDEGFTIDLVSPNSIIGIIIGTANDVHPPLYYIIAKFFVSLFGSSIQVYKIVSIIPMLLTMIMSMTSINKSFGFRTSILFILFINAIPCVLEYVVQIRMYSWAVFFLTFSILMAYRVFKCDDVRYYVAVSVSALCACYTHNFAMISAFFIFLILGIALFIRDKKFPMRWLICGIVVAAAYIPWLFVLYKQTTSRIDNYWIEPITPNTILGYADDIFGSRIPYSTAMFTIICVFAIVLNIVRLVRKRDNLSLYSTLLILIPILTATLGIVVSILITPFFVARYLIPCMGILAFSLAISYSRESNLSFCMLCLFLVIMFCNSYYTNYVKEYKSTYTQELLDYMEDNLGENDYIIYNYDAYAFIYKYYFDVDKLFFVEDFDFNLSYDNVWFFDSCNNVNLSDTTLEEFNLSKEYIASWGLEHNNFILYKISHN